MANKKKQPPKNAAVKIEQLAADGHIKRGVAKGMRVSFETLHRWLQEFPELEEAYENGRYSQEFFLQDKLFQKAKNGDTVALIFILKGRFKWRDQGTDGGSDGGNRVQINFSIPAALSPEQYEQLNKMIDANPRPSNECLSGPLLIRS